MLISVVMPVYNAERFLRKTLDTIIGQKFNDLEIICIDDCSTDSSLQILREYEKLDKRVKILENHENLRQAMTRNIGLEAASGEWIHFVDSDDFIAENTYEILANIIKENKDVDVISFGHRHINAVTGEITYPLNESGNSIGGGGKLYYNSRITFKDDPFIMEWWTIALWDKCIRKDFLLNHDIKFNNHCTSEDVQFAFDMILNDVRIFHIEESFYTHQIDIKTSESNCGVFHLDCHIADLRYLTENARDFSKEEKYYFLKKQTLRVFNYTFNAFEQGLISAKELKSIILNEVNVEFVPLACSYKHYLYCRLKKDSLVVFIVCYKIKHFVKTKFQKLWEIYLSLKNKSFFRKST